MRITSLSGIVVAGLFIVSGCEKKVQPPNIVLIMTDDQGYGDFGFTGNEIVETPVLDQLKEEALLFDRFYVSPVSAPTRASLLTGRYHLRTGTTWVTHGKEIMRPEEKTIAESFSDNGYVTACFGKWHNGEHFPHNPKGQGFDTFFGFNAGHLNNYFDTKLEYNGEEVVTTGYITDVLTDSVLSFIEENRDEPFLCYVPYNTPHGPFQVADKYFDKYKEKGMDDKNAAIYGMCENIDDNIGRILKKLDELELSDNTIVLFMTDNGPNGVRYNAGMKGIKGHVDEGGVRVPLLIRYPGVVPAGKTQHGLASHIDILPTLHGLCRLKFKEELPLDGMDLSPYILSGDTIPDRLIFTHQVRKSLQPSPVSVRSPKYRLVIQPDGETSLYNMLEDPGQERDISDIEPGVTARLTDTIAGWYADVTQDLPYQPAIPVGYEESPVVTLPAPEAELDGGVHFFGGNGWANDWLFGFEDGENTASWTLDVKKEGIYDVHLTYAAIPWSKRENILIYTEAEMLYFAVPERMNAFVVKSPDRVPRGEVIERKWPTVKVGSFNLKKGEEKLYVGFNGELKSRLEVKAVVLKMR